MMKISALNVNDNVGEDTDNNMINNNAVEETANDMVKIKVENTETVKNDDNSDLYSSCLSEPEEDMDSLGCSNCLNAKFKTKQTQEENVLLKKQMKAKDEHIDRLTESNNRVKRIYRERNASQTERIQELENDNNLLKE